MWNRHTYFLSISKVSAVAGNFKFHTSASGMMKLNTSYKTKRVFYLCMHGVFYYPGYITFITLFMQTASHK